MRKALIFILLAALLAGLCACGGKQEKTDMKAELAGKTLHILRISSFGQIPQERSAR